jgi:hypothetical protein
MVRKIGSLLVILLLVVILVLLVRQAQLTTGSPTPTAIPSPPDFVGWVLSVDPGLGQVKVESQADKIVRPVTVILTKDTLILRRENGVLRQIDMSEVHLQDQAELWLIGPVPSSFPTEVHVRQMIVEKLY